MVYCRECDWCPTCETYKPARRSSVIGIRCHEHSSVSVTRNFLNRISSVARKNCLIRRGRSFSVLSNADFIHSEKAEYPWECLLDSLYWQILCILSRKVSLMTGCNMFFFGGILIGFSCKSFIIVIFWGIYYIALAIYERIWYSCQVARFFFLFFCLF